MVRVTSQAKAQAIRRDVRFCYLCGKRLPATRSGEVVSAEHVLPRSLLPKATPSAWLIILDVHVQCEATLKREHDSWIRLYYQFTSPAAQKVAILSDLWDKFLGSQAYDTAMSSGSAVVRSSFLAWISSVAGSDIGDLSEAWIRHLHAIPIEDTDAATLRLRERCIGLVGEVFDPGSALPRGHYKGAPFRLDFIQPPGSESPIPALAGGEELARGVWTWVRGLHTFLYGEYLPVGAPHRTLGDIPWLGEDTPIDEPRTTSEKIHHVLKAAEQADSWDGVVAWGDDVLYRNVWVTHVSRPQHARCLWTLDIDSSIDRSDGGYTHWCGFYDAHQVPGCASCIGDEELRLYSLPDANGDVRTSNNGMQTDGAARRR